MARPIKTALEYYPMDCNFQQLIKIKKLKRACGPESISVLVSIFGYIFGDKGYYLDWNEDTNFIISEDSGDVEDEKVDKIVRKATEIGIFDREMLESRQILTSKEIQEQYFHVIKQSRRKGLSDPDYLLIDLKDVSSEESPISSEETPVPAEEMQTANGFMQEETGVNTVEMQQTKEHNTKTNQIKKNKNIGTDNVECYPQTYQQSQSYYPCSMSSSNGNDDSPLSVVTKEDLKKVGFRKEDTLNILMRKVQEHGITKGELADYEMRSREPSIREPLTFIYGAIWDHYTW